jgi:hypothetical protein
VVACLAAMLGFDACGIEVEPELVDAARELADDFELPVEFTCGSFIPAGSEDCRDVSEGFSWLNTSADQACGIDVEPDHFDVIFAYPWPDDERVTGWLFERHARPGAVLLTYHAAGHFRARRKKNGRSPRRRPS